MHPIGSWSAWLPWFVVGSLAAQGGLQGADAQVAQVAKLRQDVASADGSTVAWAAHHARKGRSKQLVAPLQRALGDWRRREGGDARLVCLHLLDALMALDAEVPAGELVELVDDEVCGVAAVVLLVREPKTNEAELMALFRRDLERFGVSKRSGLELLAEQHERRTMILADVLARQSPPGFVALVAPRCEWRLQIVVHDPGKSERWGRGAFAPTGPASSPTVAGWPPRPLFWLDHPAAARMRVPTIKVLPGLPWVVTREEPVADGIAKDALWTFALPSGEQSQPPFEEQWLACAGSAAERPQLRVAFPFANDAAYTKAAGDARDRLQRCVDQLRTRFVARGDLTAEQAAKWLPARIGVEVQDLRTGQAPPLPALPQVK